MSDHEVLVDVPSPIDCDWLLRCRTDRFQPDLKTGDLLIVRDRDQAHTGEFVAIEKDERIGIERYEPGMEFRGVVAGFWRKLA